MEIGDQGIGGQQINLSLKDIFVATAGFNPMRVIPVIFDMGTNNKHLLEDPYYLGIKKQRESNEIFMDLLEEFFEVSKIINPRASFVVDGMEPVKAQMIMERFG